jgi:hypothetical protein
MIYIKLLKKQINIAHLTTNKGYKPIKIEKKIANLHFNNYNHAKNIE